MKNSLSSLPSPLRVSLILSALALAVSQAGCFAVVAGAGAGAAVAFKMGEMQSTIPAGLVSTEHATETALDHLQFALIMERKDALNADITARTALDRKVRILLTAQTDNSTKVAIRVGVFGDEAVSLRILEEIRRGEGG